MGHKHEFEAYFHPYVTDKARGLGIKSVELRKCKGCGKEMTVVLTDKEWFPLFEYRDSDEQDILLA